MLPIGGAGAHAVTNAETKRSSAMASPRAISAAHEFEAQMMKELLKPLTGGDGSQGDDEDQALSSGNALGDFASEALSRGISDRGGVGIANRIVRSFVDRGEDGTKSASPVVKD